MSRSYYSSTIQNFLADDEAKILGLLAEHHEFALEDLQKNAWIKQIKILKASFPDSIDGSIYIEYSIPRMGKRVDAILLFRGIIFVIEFKVGEGVFASHALDQVIDYALDLKNFHEQSHDRVIIPILVATEAKEVENILTSYDDKIYAPFRANKGNLGRIILDLAKGFVEPRIDPLTWENSLYKPTPTIIEAAQALYRGHNVSEISRSDAGATNLSRTTEIICKIIEETKLRKQKTICFVTGVPGAGKTLAGLNIANERLKVDQDEHTVFLSGNGPLVAVLREALARNDVQAQNSGITKRKAITKASAFIQNIHHFRDDALAVDTPPLEKVVIFDEAQRAWTLDQTAAFMLRKKGKPGFSMSEPEFLINVMDRHEDWAVIICLVGGGQEINTGEAGLYEWFSAIHKSFPHWQVYSPKRLTDDEYTRGKDIFSLLNPNQLNLDDDLHLAVSLRSFRSEKVSALIKSILDNDLPLARELYKGIKSNYPIVITRDLEKAKEWLKTRARGTERFGILASSGAYRLKPFGINVQTKIDVQKWFLEGKEDVRSSYFLEDAATEFDVQGLELDWTCLAWDADLRYNGTDWEYKKFSGTIWRNVKDETRRLYLKNTYRVLLTRARQGMVIFIPYGNDEDKTRSETFYCGTFNFLKDIGFETI